MTTIYLIRHAAYENPKGIMHGRSPGFPLSKEGKKQAETVARMFAKKPIVAVYSSRLLRAHQTATIIAKKHGVSIWTDERLLDIRTPLEGKPLSYIGKLDSYFYRPEFIAAGGETLKELFDRMDHFLKQKAADHPREHIVVVSHGDGIMSVATKYAGKKLPSHFPYDHTYVGQTEGFMIVINNKGKKKITKLPKTARG